MIDMIITKYCHRFGCLFLNYQQFWSRASILLTWVASIVTCAFISLFSFHGKQIELADYGFRLVGLAKKLSRQELKELFTTVGHQLAV